MKSRATSGYRKSPLPYKTISRKKQKHYMQAIFAFYKNQSKKCFQKSPFFLQPVSVLLKLFWTCFHFWLLKNKILFLSCSALFKLFLLLNIVNQEIFLFFLSFYRGNLLIIFLSCIFVIFLTSESITADDENASLFELVTDLILPEKNSTFGWKNIPIITFFS